MSAGNIDQHLLLLQSANSLFSLTKCDLVCESTANNGRHLLVSVAHFACAFYQGSYKILVLYYM